MLPTHTWKKNLNDPLPPSSVHNYSTPPIMEALGLIPLAIRVGSHISHEKSQGRGTVFDLNGATLHPPHPGPYGGCPIGGMGNGSIGRGYRGDFRRWSLHPGKYVHRIVDCDQFSLRVKRGDIVESVVLSALDCDRGSPLSSWNWGRIPSQSVRYEASYPRAWMVFDEPLPGIRVTIRQVSPFIPHSYSETSFPVGLFHVDVENLGEEEVEASVMFTFQNGYGGTTDSVGGKVHSNLQCEYSEEVYVQPPIAGLNRDEEDEDVHTHVASVLMLNKDGGRDAPEAGPNAGVDGEERYSCAASCSPVECSDKSSGESQRSASASSPTSTSASVSDRCSFAIAASCSGSDSRADGVLSQCSQFVVDSTANSHWLKSIFGRSNCTQWNSASALWEAFHSTGDVTLNPYSATTSAASSSSSFAAADDRGSVPASATSSIGIELEPSRSLSEVSSASSINANKMVSEEGCTVAAAVCLRKSIRPNALSQFSFSVAWDIPYVRFGSESDLSGKRGAPPPVPKFYTRFWGLTGEVAASIATYALLHATDWERRIGEWQNEIDKLNEDTATKTASSTTGCEDASAIPDYYKHMVFNELYFLVDGGTMWTDTCDGKPNDVSGAADPILAPTEFAMTLSDDLIAGDEVGRTGEDEEDEGRDGEGVFAAEKGVSFSLSVAARSLSEQHIRAVRLKCLKHDAAAQYCGGNQTVVGQFLYLEGHEYLMYNTYDVHFYASFALMMLFPQLELSLQRDFAAAVGREDHSSRQMLANGHMRTRKVKGAVPHDLGSPFEKPWSKINAYNLQDVSRWKDLGPKFVLQVYRDYKYELSREQSSCSFSRTPSPSSFSTPPSGGSGCDRGSSKATESALCFLSEVFPAVIATMELTHQYDKDGDGMIENEGFPDQTYDIWTAEGVHAYCGGLWITANEAAAEMCTIVGVFDRAEGFRLTASRARVAYIDALWNGKYLNYDSSSSPHSDSIMADMMAGHWYARVCDLPGVLPASMALSCFDSIFDFNVMQFGQGELIGAVNGMRPNGTVDSSCMQSREVWTGTTYALAAAMMQEALYMYSTSTASGNRGRSRSMVAASPIIGTSATTSVTAAAASAVSTDSPRVISDKYDGNETTTESQSPEVEKVEAEVRCDRLIMSRKLWSNAFATAQGVHDGGWQKFGYWFATPEAWERSGNYRSLGYMRPLSIWALQYALQKWNSK